MSSSVHLSVFLLVCEHDLNEIMHFQRFNFFDLLYHYRDVMYMGVPQGVNLVIVVVDPNVYL